MSTTERRNYGDFSPIMMMEIYQKNSLDELCFLKINDVYQKWHRLQLAGVSTGLELRNMNLYECKPMQKVQVILHVQSFQVKLFISFTRCCLIHQIHLNVLLRNEFSFSLQKFWNPTFRRHLDVKDQKASGGCTVSKIYRNELLKKNAQMGPVFSVVFLFV